MKGEIVPIKSVVKLPLTLISQGFNLKIKKNNTGICKINTRIYSIT